jgi:hypothetical protein
MEVRVSSSNRVITDFVRALNEKNRFCAHVPERRIKDSSNDTHVLFQRFWQIPASWLLEGVPHWYATSRVVKNEIEEHEADTFGDDNANEFHESSRSHQGQGCNGSGQDTGWHAHVLTTELEPKVDTDNVNNINKTLSILHRSVNALTKLRFP